MDTLKTFFSDSDKKRILDAVKEAESATSGEIRIRIERKAGADPMGAARRAFEEMGMRKTDLHNGVMFLLAVEDRAFVILGDDGIDRKVPEGFWDKVRDAAIENFRKGDFATGLVEGIRLAGKELSAFFPRKREDRNELPDAISYADGKGDL